MALLTALSSELKHKELTDRIIRTFYDVYNELGFGFLESVYERSIILALGGLGLGVLNQVQIPVWFRNERVGNFVADVIVENLVLLELKATRCIDETHKAQLLNYLKSTHIEVGLLLNFGPKPEFKRMAFDNDRKVCQRSPTRVSKIDAKPAN